MAISMKVSNNLKLVLLAVARSLKLQIISNDVEPFAGFFNLCYNYILIVQVIMWTYLRYYYNGYAKFCIKFIIYGVVILKF